MRFWFCEAAYFLFAFFFLAFSQSLSVRWLPAPDWLVSMCRNLTIIKSQRLLCVPRALFHCCFFSSSPKRCFFAESGVGWSGSTQRLHQSASWYALWHRRVRNGVWRARAGFLLKNSATIPLDGSPVEILAAVGRLIAQFLQEKNLTLADVRNSVFFFCFVPGCSELPHQINLSMIVSLANAAGLPLPNLDFNALKALIVNCFCFFTFLFFIHSSVFFS